MKKIFEASQVKEIDECTIKEEGITSYELMKRASLAVFEELRKQLDKDLPIKIFGGNGNNGGDAFVIAKLLLEVGYKMQPFFIGNEEKITKDCKSAREELSKLIEVRTIESELDIIGLNDSDQIVDGLLGVGVNRPAEGLLSKLIQLINNSQAKVYSIDMPSGLYGENNNTNNEDSIIQADTVFTMQFPKLSLLLPQAKPFCKQLRIIDIGLSETSMSNMETPYHYIEEKNIKKLIHQRDSFSHKGTYGHALLVGGSYGKVGAILLATKACLRAGVGLITVHLPKCGVDILQTAIPEAMIDIDSDSEYITGINDFDLSKYTIGIGPALGQKRETKDFFYQLLETSSKPMVIDADALNLIASDDMLRRKIPENSILTPHPIEFERLIGLKCRNSYERLQKARQYAHENKIYMVLKGAYSAIITPQSDVYFNSTGNPGMATGGSGDTLTGIITSLLAQKYTSFDAVLVGVYIHGLAGDIAASKFSEQSMLPSDLINCISQAYLMMKK